MSYEKRTPPVKLILAPNNFNKLLNYLNILEHSKEEKIQQRATKLKEKILKYSIPFTNKEEKELIDIRFFISEASDLLFMFLQDNETVSEVDYYQDFLTFKESQEKSAK